VKTSKILTGFCLFYVIVNLLSLRLPFFWGDAIVQSSIAAQWYYDHDFAHFFLPVKDNPGHPPFFGMYLALWWKVLGQNLVVTHLSMLPFLIGIAYQFFHITRYFLPTKFLIFGLILFALEPTILAQATMVTPELPMLFLYLLAIRAMLYRQIFWQVLAMCIVVLLNTRGAMLVAVVFLSEVLILFIENFLNNTTSSGHHSLWKRLPDFKSLFRLSLKYIPAGIVALTWLFVHYYIEGWIGFNRADMPWKNSFIPVQGMGILKNIGVFGWRLLDFGRGFMWFVVALAALKWLRNKKIDKKNLSLLALIIAPLFVFAPAMLPYVGTLQHRYLLPFFAMFVIGVAYCFYELNKKTDTEKGRISRSNYVLFLVVIIGLLTGHLWVYPDKVSQGWEASLAHLPYFNVRDKMTNYVLEKGIAPNDIATGSPNKYRRLDSDLQPDGTWKFIDIDEVRYDTFPYIVYSNIFNDFADSTYHDLHSNWKHERTFKRGQIRITLFARQTVEDER